MESLPEDVIVSCILAKLRDASALARCAAVSREWRRMSGSVGSLHFDFPTGCVVRSLDAEKIVWAVISRGGGMIEELSLKFSPSEPSMVCLCENSVQLWIQHISATIRELKLSNRGCAFSDLLPSLSACIRLQSLSLEFGYFDGIPAGCAFNELRKCHFANVIFHGDDLERFVSGCPVLEVLSLDECFSTQIPAVSLRSDSIREMSIVDAKFNKMTIAMGNLRILSTNVHVHLHSHSLEQLRIARAESNWRRASFGNRLDSLRILALDGRGWIKRHIESEILSLAANLRELHLMPGFAFADLILLHTGTANNSFYSPQKFPCSVDVDESPCSDLESIIRSLLPPSARLARILNDHHPQDPCSPR